MPSKVRNLPCPPLNKSFMRLLSAITADASAYDGTECVYRGGTIFFLFPGILALVLLIFLFIFKKHFESVNRHIITKIKIILLLTFILFTVQVEKSNNDAACHNRYTTDYFEFKFLPKHILPYSEALNVHVK